MEQIKQVNAALAIFVCERAKIANLSDRLVVTHTIVEILLARGEGVEPSNSWIKTKRLYQFVYPRIWLPRLDSNQDYLLQRQVSYR